VALPDRPETSPRRAADLEPRPLAAHVVPNASRQRCRTRTYRCGTSASSKPTLSLESRAGGAEGLDRGLDRGRDQQLDRHLDERGGAGRKMPAKRSSGRGTCHPVRVAHLNPAVAWGEQPPPPAVFEEPGAAPRPFSLIGWIVCLLVATLFAPLRAGAPIGKTVVRALRALLFP